MSVGKVYLVGAGPGDPSLITLRGRRLLARADVVIYDRLTSNALLTLCRTDALKIDFGKAADSGGRAQQAINDLIIEHAKRGLNVVRLKGGDPGVFGRSTEEQAACFENGVPCVIVPGVSSFLAAPASIGLAATQRGRSRSFTVITARGCDGSGAESLDYAKLVRDETLFIMMGRRELGAICAGLIDAGGDPHLPVVCIERATTSRQRVCRGTLADVASNVERDGLQAPMVTIVGEIAATDRIESLGLSPLIGAKVAITGTDDLCAKLAEELVSRGAEPIHCPLIRIAFSPVDAKLDVAVNEIDQFDWIAFSSVNSVRGFFRRLALANLDARALAHCRIASVGSATSRELKRRGIVADIQSPVETGAGLAAAIIAVAKTGQRVLLPRSDRALRALPTCLQTAGMHVTEVVAYRTLTIDPPADVVDQINRSADAILFASPSAVTCAVAASVRTEDRVVVCIGPSTVSACQQNGIKVDAVADRASAESMVDALQTVSNVHLGLSGVGG
ncbi:MAG TPA: uroporphyrinogen-III C-methyltransferase [Phycisphaerae bacterium]|nr:uroporphyrinogen-III C-methyltransferase [Phycisphaerae bacterium]